VLHCTLTNHKPISFIAREQFFQHLASGESARGRGQGQVSSGASFFWVDRAGQVADVIILVTISDYSAVATGRGSSPVVMLLQARSAAILRAIRTTSHMILSCGGMFIKGTLQTSLRYWPGKGLTGPRPNTTLDIAELSVPHP
jgi:hypothetical protein